MTDEREAAAGKPRAVRFDPNRVLNYTLAALLGGALVGLVQLAVWAPRPGAERDALDPLKTPPARYDWTAQPSPAFPVPPYARFLEQVKIVIDPGHGGRAERPNWKRGPTGLREAEVNLRIALFLRDFLRAAGAQVTLTREDDAYLHEEDAIDLQLRADIANQQQADLLVSIHHNLADSADANFTTVFYHGRPDDSPASLAAARHLLAGLNDALRLERHIGSALQSDYAIYPPPKDGFAILRHARVPAVLTEASFYSNLQEEQRLRDPVYNRREAYGLFLGLARWAQAGLPRVRLVSPENGRLKPGKPVVVRLDDGLRERGDMGSDLSMVFASSIVVRLDDEPVAFEYDADKHEVRFTPPALAVFKSAELYVNFLNKYGQPVLHPLIELRSGVE